jgi:2-polyprenyl-6-hydroxyphenyl methylase/3-demethylubiquinone-9 3-methyltransferase
MSLRWKIAQALEWRWWFRYLKKKPPAQYLAQKRAYWKRTLEAAAIKVVEGGKILDAGCGPAGIFIMLDTHRVDALDPLLSKYESLPHFSRRNYEHIHFIESPIEALQRENYYDQIFCLNVINHVAALEQSLEVLIKALKPGSQLVLSVDAHRYSLLKHIFRLLPGDVLHPHQHGLKDYEAMLEKHGARVERSLRLKPGRVFDYCLLAARKPADF